MVQMMKQQRLQRSLKHRFLVGRSWSQTAMVMVVGQNGRQKNIGLQRQNGLSCELVVNHHVQSLGPVGVHNSAKPRGEKWAEWAIDSIGCRCTLNSYLAGVARAAFHLPLMALSGGQRPLWHRGRSLVVEQLGRPWRACHCIGLERLCQTDGSQHRTPQLPSLPTQLPG